MAKKDLGVIQADKDFLELEKRLNKIYKEASIDVQQKMDVYFARYQKKNDTWLAKLKAAENTDEYPQLQKEYKAWLKGQVFQGKQWKARQQSIANTLLHSNEVAINMINDAIPEVFQFNGNYAAYQLEHSEGVDFGFNLYDSTTVKKIVADDVDILPFKKLNKAKDLKWNFQSIKNEVAKGIIEGESIDKISKRLATVIPDRNKSMLRTHARTMVTSAQNAGRLERFKDAQSKGLEMEKEWFCTLDGRTRDTHRLLDRQRKPLDEPFEVDGFKIMYPADSHAHPSMVYNCRCTMNSYMKKYPPQYTTRSARNEDGNSVLIKDMSYKEWEEWKNGGSKATKQAKTVPNVKKVTNKQEATESLKKMFTDVDDDKLLKLNETLVVDNVNQINALNARFKVIKNNGSYFSVNSSKKAFAYARGGFRDGKSELSISDKFYKKLDNYIAEETKAKKSFWCMPFDDSQLTIYTITHEYGHLLEAEISHNRFDFDNFKEKNSTFNLALQMKELDKEEKKQAKTIMGEIIGIAKENNADFDLEKNLSRYGRTNDFEAFAEIFANSQLGAPNELGIAMQQWLEKEGF